MYRRIQRYFLPIMILCLGIFSFTELAAAQFDDSPDSGFTFLMCIIIALLIGLILTIFTGIWMYRDANSRGMDGAVWAVLLVVGILAGNLIGYFVIVIIYLVVRRDVLPYPQGYYPPPGLGYYPPPYGYSTYPPPPPGSYPPPPPSSYAPPTSSTSTYKSSRFREERPRKRDY